jgi:hypothetical protein
MLAGARRWPAGVGLAALALAAGAFVRARAAPAPSRYFTEDRLPHMPPIRYVEIAIAAGSLLAASVSPIRRLTVVRTAAV